jgi:hypothetical protein
MGENGFESAINCKYIQNASNLNYVSKELVSRHNKNIKKIFARPVSYVSES